MNPRTWFAIAIALLAMVPAALDAPALEGSFAPLGPTAVTEPAILVNSINTPGNATSMYKIANPGSYYLAGNIAGSGGKYGIEIASSDVTLDLRGYRMVVYTGQTSAGAIWVSFNGMHDIVIRNGIIDSWKGYGLDLTKASNVLLENMLVSGCGKSGFNLGTNSTLLRCRAARNAQQGIYCEGAATLNQCSVTNNGYMGIFSPNALVMTECQAMENGTTGIQTNSGSIVTRCTARGNKNYGFAAFGCSLIDCTATDNARDGIYADGSLIRGCMCSGNKINGIQVWRNCMVENNHCVKNVNAGIRVQYSTTSLTGGGTGNRVEHNQVSSNGMGLDAYKPCADNLFLNNFSSGTVLGNFVDYDENIAAPTVKTSTDLATRPNDAAMFMPTYP